MCMTDRQIDIRMKKLDELEKEKKELEKQITKIQNEIKKEIGDAEQIATGKWIVKFTKIISSRFDTAKFKTDHKKLYDSYCKPSETRRFTYKAIA